MGSKGGGIVDAAAATSTTSRRLSSTLRDSCIATDPADGLKSTSNVNHNCNYYASPRPVSNLTLGTVLYGKKKKSSAPSKAVIRTIAAMIRNGETLNIGGGSPSRKNSWRSFKEKLKRKKGQCQNHCQNRNSRRRTTSTLQVPQSDLLPGSRNSLRRVDSAPADDLSLMEVDNCGMSNALSAEREQTRRRLSRELDVDGVNMSDQGNDDEEDACYYSAPENNPVRTSLMDLLEQTDRQAGISGTPYRIGNDMVDDETEESEMEEELGKGEYSCCVCMVRHKGAAFIPCGHTFCRLCSRELFVQRGHCPLCNNYIMEILHIF